MTDDERALLACFRASDCETFSHEQHLHVAWLLLQELPLSRAIEQFAAGAQGLAASRGRPDFYHETITWAFMILVHERVAQQPKDAWEPFRERNADLFAPDKAALKRYYRSETLESDFARKTFVMPDRLEP